MAGTLPGIPLSQQFSAVGKPLPGNLLYIYAANTTTPQDSFLDQGLTLKNPWPLAADASGRVPMFYLADGSVHVRLTDNGGVVQFDYPAMMVVGPSSGGGGGGGSSVDPTAIFQTGDCIWFETPVTGGFRTGWVRDNGKTIGNAGSGASERANADCQNLFVYLYTNKTNTECPVTGGRSGNALSDFNAGKQLQLPDKRGYTPCGATDMGNADLANLAGVPFTFGNSITMGAKGGEATHKLVTSEIPSHNHTLNDPGHNHPISQADTVNNVPNNFVVSGKGAALGNNGVAVVNTQTGITIAAVGGDGNHNVTSLIVIGCFYRKL